MSCGSPGAVGTASRGLPTGSLGLLVCESTSVAAGKARPSDVVTLDDLIPDTRRTHLITTVHVEVTFIYVSLRCMLDSVLCDG